MRTVGIRELKANLSRLLRDVERGDVLLVTDRGRVVAELRRPGQPPVPESAVHRALASLSAQGGLRIGEPAPDAYQPSPLRSPAGTALTLLMEERGDT